VNNALGAKAFIIKSTLDAGELWGRIQEYLEEKGGGELNRFFVPAQAFHGRMKCFVL
jgi:hypothetical protein